MNALMMPLKVRLPDKFLVAVVDLAVEGILAFLVVCLLVRLEVVAATE